MVSPFELVVKALVDLGFYGFVLPFIISATVFYAILRRSKALGESNIINAVLSISLAFMVFGFPVITGTALDLPMVTFFTQITVFTLIFIMAGVVASIFYPNFPEFLNREFKRRTWLFISVALSVGLLITSGLISVILSAFAPKTGPGGAQTGPPQEVLILAGGLVVFMILLIVATAIQRTEEGK